MILRGPAPESAELVEVGVGAADEAAQRYCHNRQIEHLPKVQEVAHHTCAIFIRRGALNFVLGLYGLRSARLVWQRRSCLNLSYFNWIGSQ